MENKEEVILEIKIIREPESMWVETNALRYISSSERATISIDLLPKLIAKQIVNWVDKENYMKVANEVVKTLMDAIEEFWKEK